VLEDYFKHFSNANKLNIMWLKDGKLISQSNIKFNLFNSYFYYNILKIINSNLKKVKLR